MWKPNVETVYHSSPEEIKSFCYNKDDTTGVHFGGIYSSLEAALRKYENLELDTGYIYIHRCVLEYNDSEVESTLDMGSAWEDLLVNGTDVTIFQYRNEYEYDIKPSYWVLKDYHIMLTKIHKIPVQEARDILEDFYTYDNFSYQFYF